MGRTIPEPHAFARRREKGGQFRESHGRHPKTHEIKLRRKSKFPLIIPISVISNDNYMHLADIHRLVLDTTQLHPYYFGWFITEERAALHEKVFKERFGFAPKNHRGYLNRASTTLTRMSPPANSRNHPHVKGPCIGAPIPARHYHRGAGPPLLQRTHMGLRCIPNAKAFTSSRNLPDGRVTPCRDYQDIPPAISTNSPFTTFGTRELRNVSGKEMQKGAHARMHPLLRVAGILKGLNANLQRYSSGMIKFIIIAITILLVLEEYFGGLSLRPIFQQKDKNE